MRCRASHEAKRVPHIALHINMPELLAMVITAYRYGIVTVRVWGRLRVEDGPVLIKGNTTSAAT